jgi:hypothetical protein
MGMKEQKEKRKLGWLPPKNAKEFFCAPLVNVDPNSPLAYYVLLGEISVILLLMAPIPLLYYFLCNTVVAAARGGFPDFNEVHMGILLTGFAHTLFSGFAFVNLFLIPFGRYLGHLITVICLSVSTVIPAIALLLLFVL